jgi:hypothetical protein
MKKVLTICLVLLGVSFLAGCGQQPASQTQPTTPAPVAQQSQYKDDSHKLEFSYNSEWNIAPINTSMGYDSSQPYLLVWSGETSNIACYDLGCSPKSGDRDELTKGDTLEGAPPLNPWFKILRVRGNKWVLIQLTDTTKNCQTEEECQSYLSSALITQKVKTNKVGYQAYNDFIELISTLKFNE